MAGKERAANIQAAKQAIASEKLSLRQAGERYDVPKSTLHRHVQTDSGRCGAGRPTVLTEEEEKTIVRSCQELARIGFGLDRILVARVVRDYLKAKERDNPFKDGVPGQKWWTNFFRRWPSLVQRKPQHFPRNRAEASTPTVMDHYFENLKVNGYNIIQIQFFFNFANFNYRNTLTSTTSLSSLTVS